MQYILSEEEMAEIHRLNATLAMYDRIFPDQQTLQETCKKIANEWATHTAYDGSLRPWGCILTVEGEHYCDQCPVRKICPFPHKDFSK